MQSKKQEEEKYFYHHREEKCLWLCDNNINIDFPPYMLSYYDKQKNFNFISSHFSRLRIMSQFAMLIVEEEKYKAFYCQKIVFQFAENVKFGFSFGFPRKKLKIIQKSFWYYSVNKLFCLFRA